MYTHTYMNISHRICRTLVLASSGYCKTIVSGGLKEQEVTLGLQSLLLNPGQACSLQWLCSSICIYQS